MATAEVKDLKGGAELVKDFLGGRAARSGAELVKALRLSGTPDEKLKPARSLLAAKRNATAAEVAAALEEAGTPPGTLAKARSLMETGKVRPPAAQKAAIEDEILTGGEPKAAPKK